MRKLQAVPGMEAAAISTSGPGTWSVDDFHIEGRDEVLRGSQNHIGIRSGSYFHALRLPLISGRLLANDDCIPESQAAVVNQAMARAGWPGQDPLGKRLTCGKRHYRVVGVVKNMLDWKRDAPPRPTLYEPIERADMGFLRGQFFIRSSLNPEGLRRVLQRLGEQMAPTTKLLWCISIESELDSSTAPRRAYMWLLSGMGGLGLLLSALGVYAVMAYAVTRRTQEIGIRMAMGASRSNIGQLILGRGGRLLINGLVLGAVVAFTLAQYVESLLYRVKPGDPWVYLGVVGTLGAAAGIAGYLPARRAMKINPMTALRYE